jgi:putative phosphoribosyl transferase
MFRNRTETGRRLADRLRHLKHAAPVVLAIPRGGVPVAVPIASALDAPLDLLLARKLGAPGQPELALGAVVEGDPPQTVLNERIVREFGILPAAIAEEAARELETIARRRRRWLHGRPAIPTRGRTAIVVDDGVATGATVRAALSALSRAGAARRVLAVPVAAYSTAEALRRLCEEVVVLCEPDDFQSVGAHYRDFRQLEDDEVAALLNEQAGRHRMPR